jgi:hypothetical protein
MATSVRHPQSIAERGDPPPRPTPPPILRVCDNCWKPWGTCWCKTWFVANIVLFAFIAGVLFVVFIVADTAHGAELIAFNKAAAHDNAQTIANSNGDVDAPAGIVYIEIPVRYSPNGGTIKGKGGAGLACSNAQCFNDDNPLYTVATRFVATNPAPDKDFLVLCGTGQKVRDIQFYGRAHEDRITVTNRP